MMKAFQTKGKIKELIRILTKNGSTTSNLQKFQRGPSYILNEDVSYKPEVHNYEDIIEKQRFGGFDVLLPFTNKSLKTRANITKEHDNFIFGKKFHELEHITPILLEKIKLYLNFLATNKKDPNLSLECNFYLKTKSFLNSMQKKGTKIEIVNDIKAFEKKELKEVLKIVEISHIYGLNSNRIVNLPAECYSIEKKFDSAGINVYMPTIIPSNFKPKNDHFLIRLQVDLITPLSLNFGEGERGYVHHLVFENQMRQPPKLSRIDLEIIDWLKLFRFSDWILCDVDNYMGGNKILYNSDAIKKVYGYIED